MCYVGIQDSSRLQNVPFVIWDSAASAAVENGQAVLAVVLRLVNSSWPLSVADGRMNLTTMQVFPAIGTLAVLTRGLVESSLVWPAGDYRDSGVAERAEPNRSRGALGACDRPARAIAAIWSWRRQLPGTAV